MPNQKLPDIKSTRPYDIKEGAKIWKLKLPHSDLSFHNTAYNGCFGTFGK